MSKVYNYNLIIEALNKHTNEKFKFDGENDIFYSDIFEIEETSNYMFSLTETKQDLSTGIYDCFFVEHDLTLADLIDKINEMTRLEEEEEEEERFKKARKIMLNKVKAFRENQEKERLK